MNKETYTMSDYNEYEYTVAQKPEGKWKRRRFLMVLGYVVFGLLFFFGFFALKLYPLMALVILAEWILVFFTWRYVSVEYKFYTASGKISFICIYGGRTKKTVLEMSVKDFESITPVSDASVLISDKGKYARVDIFVSSVSSPDIYCGVYKNSDGVDCAVCFEATQKLLKIMKYYNPATVIGQTRF